MPDYFSQPDDFGPPKMSDIYRVEKAKMITDAHTFIVPTIWLGVAIFFWLGMRFLFASSSARNLRRRLGQWIAGERD
jgi:hypothetical protein